MNYQLQLAEKIEMAGEHFTTMNPRSQICSEAFITAPAVRVEAVRAEPKRDATEIKSFSGTKKPAP